MNRVSWPTIEGPLAPYGVGFREELGRLGYSDFTSSFHLYLMNDASRWLDAKGLPAGDFQLAEQSQFLAYRRASGRTTRITARGLRPMVDYLHRAGVLLDEPTSLPRDAVGIALAEYSDYLRLRRGIMPSTEANYRRVSEQFLSAVTPTGSMRSIEIGAVNAFLVSFCS